MEDSQASSSQAGTWHESLTTKNYTDYLYLHTLVFPFPSTGNKEPVLKNKHAMCFLEKSKSATANINWIEDIEARIL